LLESTARWNGFRDKTMSKHDTDDLVDALKALSSGAAPEDLSPISMPTPLPAETSAAPIPAPDAQALSSPARGSDDRANRIRRTLIPILLTCGVLLIATASLKWIAGPISVFAQLELWMAILMIALGAMLLAVAGLNMLQVRDQLLRNPARGGSKLPSP
jgi:hypothetical protein